MPEIRYLSVCSGIEAASVAWEHLGWTPLAFSEVDRFASQVLAHRYPEIPNLGDMTKFRDWNIDRNAVNLLVGGTPCQSFSVAGLRKGLEDPRGNLALTFISMVDHYRPEWVIWENVPGVLSSSGGRDFGSFLGALGELGYGWAYRVVDAQWVRTQRHPRAVPQRRRRVFVVGCLGDWERAAQVLFECESVQRDSAPRRTPREVSAANAQGSVGTGGWMPNNPGVVSSVCTKWSKGTGGPSGSEHFNLVTQPIGYRWQNDRDGLVQDGTAPACRASSGSSGFHEMNHPVVVQGDTRATTAVVNMQGSKSNACVSTDGTSFTLNAMHGHDVHAVAFHPTQDPISSSGSIHALGTGSKGGCATAAVAHALRGEGFDASEDGTGRGTPLVPVETLQQQGYNGDHASTQEANAIATLRVLRDEIGEEAFAAWGLGVLDSLQPSQVLRARLHGEGIRCASFSRSWPIDCAISRQEDRAAWAVQSVREAEGEGCSPSGRELPQQLAEQLGAYLSQLPCPGPQAEKLMHHLWCAGEGIGILRQALSAIQEARRSADVPRTTPATTMTVRRLTATECEFLQGFPRNYTLIPWRKKAAADCPDGPRYKALGNSMAVNCMAWIGERIAAVENHNAN